MDYRKKAEEVTKAISFDLTALIERAIRETIEEEKEKVKILREALEDFVSHGLRADLTPTQPMGDWMKVTQFFLGYLKRIEESVTERAREALEKIK